jgi:hypothetical protein
MEQISYYSKKNYEKKANLSPRERKIRASGE